MYNPPFMVCIIFNFSENRLELIKPDSTGLHQLLDKADGLFAGGTVHHKLEIQYIL